jgi:hypothetical protein
MIIKLGEAACKRYKKTGIIEFPKGMSQNDFGIWGSIFERENDWIGWEKVALEGIKNTINECKGNLNNNDPEVINSVMAIVVMIAHSTIRNIDVPQIKEKLPNLKEKIFDLWIKEFSDYPSFEVLFKKELEL